MMVYIYALAVVAVFFAIIFSTKWAGYVRDIKVFKSIKEAKTPTMFDVRAKIMEGKRDDAVKLYARIFNTGKTESERAVDELAANIQKS